MALYFQSICSSSSGNCLALWSSKTRILIDCGLSSMKRTRQVMAWLYGDPPQIDAVLLTHNHSDHISYYPLRVLEEYGHTLCLHDDCIEQLKDKHFNGYGFGGLRIKPFKNRKLTVGEFSIKSFEVSHDPNYPTYGFQIIYEDKKIVIVTDFCEWGNLLEYFVDADFIFVESNHDLKLLEQYYNPNSQFHMPNPGTAKLLFEAVRQSRKDPGTVMLGHISSQRNKPALAVREVTDLFEATKKQIGFELRSAPLRECSEVVVIA